MGKLNCGNWMIRACGVFLLWAAAAVALPAQTFTTLYSFTGGADGANPHATLIQGTNGKLYGTTSYGGVNSCGVGCGTVFSITAGGTLTTLHSFDFTDGEFPYAGLVQGTIGKFYGTTVFGGANNGAGTVFSMTAGGTLTTLHSFDFTDGEFPYARLVQGTNGTFYGTTSLGGAKGGYGTVFSITAGGALTTLYSFGTFTDGAYPYAGLVRGTNGKLYGTTSEGGTPNDFGTVFSITTGGTLTILHSFDSTDGGSPIGGLVQGTNGSFYGTTSGGGASGNGTVFSITAGGALTMLYSFTGGADGASPQSALIQATDGNFYGTTVYGGAKSTCNSGCGTVFSITAGGALTTLHSFTGGGDGANPEGLMQGTNGKLYGTTIFGGANGQGAVFDLSVGLGPFAETLPAFGKVGTPVHILGTDLTGATSVTFNGTPATFMVKWKTLIFTTVPTGATTGTVKVVTPKGTLSSNAPFRVAP